jgi:hypothetical protein
MPMQISRKVFEEALVELGHDPQQYIGKRLSLSSMGELYGIETEAIIEAIDKNLVSAHYDYKRDTIWIDALDAAHFFYCVTSKNAMFEMSK